MAEILAQPVFGMALLLGLLVFVHELSHFLVGRAFGIGVEMFSIGFGPPIISFKMGNTEYRLACIPLGGFVKFAGALASEPVDPVFEGSEMHRASLFARGCTIVAGPLANFFLAVFVYSVLGMQGMEHPAAVIGQVITQSPAEKAGLEPGDRVVAVDGHKVLSWPDMQKLIMETSGKPLSMAVLREQKERTFTLMLDQVELEDFAGRMGKRGRAGVGYGSLPPVVTVLGPQSLGFLAGLRTGDGVSEVVYQNPNHQERKITITHWPQLSQVLSEAFVEAHGPVVLSTYTARLDAKDNVIKENPRQVTLPIEAWRAAATRHGSEFPVRLVFQRYLMEALGLDDSQLTIASLEAPSSQVLRLGDALLAVDEVPVKDIFHLQELLHANKKNPAPLTVLRDGKKESLLVPMKEIELQKPAGKEIAFALTVGFWTPREFPKPYLEKYDNPLSALWFGLRTAAQQSVVLVGVVGGLITGTVPLKSLGGPVLIAKVVGESVKLGWSVFFTSMAMISINLFVFNLMPLPALDGGQLVLVLYQAVRRKPLSDAAQENFQRLGFVMIMALVVLATYNDLSRFWASMLRDVSGFFK